MVKNGTSIKRMNDSFSKPFAYISGLYGRFDGSGQVNPANPFAFVLAFALVAQRLPFDRIAWI